MHTLLCDAHTHNRCWIISLHREKFYAKITSFLGIIIYIICMCLYMHMYTRTCIACLLICIYVHTYIPIYTHIQYAHLYRFESSMELGNLSTLIEQICIEVGFPRDLLQNIPYYVTNEQHELIDFYPEFECYRDVVFYFKFFLTPTADALPGECIYKCIYVCVGLYVDMYIFIFIYVYHMCFYFTSLHSISGFISLLHHIHANTRTCTYIHAYMQNSVHGHRAMQNFRGNTNKITVNLLTYIHTHIYAHSLTHTLTFLQLYNIYTHRYIHLIYIYILCV